MGDAVFYGFLCPAVDGMSLGNHQHDFILKKVAGLRLQFGKGEDHQGQIHLALDQLLL